MTIGAEFVPMIGVGIGLGWAIISGNRAHARDSLQEQIGVLQNIIIAKDKEHRTIQEAKLALEIENERLKVRNARLEAERGNGHQPPRTE